MKKAAVISLLVLISVASLEAQDKIWKELSTTFMKSNHQPRTVADAEAAGWIKINGCEDTRFAGDRYAPPLDTPDMMLLYDTEGNVAGMQSVVPQEELQFTCDGTVNDFYVLDVINGMNLCLTTVYFVYPPAAICDSGAMAPMDKLSFQMGQAYEDANLYQAQETYDTADNSIDWVAQNYFIGMGHHFVPPYPEVEDCTKVKPFQTLYAQTNLQCTISGFVWQHISSTPERDGWEKPPKVAVEMILSHPPQCILDGADKKLATTMHVFLGGSTTYCLF